MTLTVDDIREHADQLQGRLDEERRKVVTGQYGGSRAANLELIDALEGRVAELRLQCELMARQAQPVRAVLVA